MDPPVSRTEAEPAFNQLLLVDGESTGGEVTTAALPVTFRTHGYPQFGRRSTRACSPAAMADGGGLMAVHQRSPATIHTGDELYCSVVLQQS